MRLDTYLTDDLEVEERCILESGASLSRVMSKLKDESVDFCIITAFRKYENGEKVSIKTNQTKNNQLLKDVRSKLGKGYGAYRLVGHWKECSVELPDDINISQCSSYGGRIEDSLEESWLILNQPSTDLFFGVMQQIAKKYKQDAFVARIDGDFGLYGKDGSKWENFGKVSNDSISSSFKKVIGLQGYSELKKKRIKGDVHNIIFDKLTENINFLGISVPNATNSSGMLYKSMNILWKEQSDT